MNKPEAAPIAGTPESERKSGGRLHVQNDPEVTQTRCRTSPSSAIHIDMSTGGLNQDHKFVFQLTKDNLDEHNRQARLLADSDIGTQSRCQQFEGLKQASWSLGIDLSNPAFAEMWQGLGGLTPMERFLNDLTSISGTRGFSQGNAGTSHP